MVKKSYFSPEVKIHKLIVNVAMLAGSNEIVRQSANNGTLYSKGDTSFFDEDDEY